jgi:predicted acyltransferase
VVHTVAIDCILLAMLIYVIDLLQRTNWTYFFEVFGRNPLFIYLLSELVVILFFFFRVGDKTLYAFIYQRLFQPMGDYFGSFLFAIAFMLFCWLIGYFLDRRKIFIRV